MSILKPIVKGSLVSEAKALADLEILADASTPRANPQPAPSPIPIAVDLQNGFYHIDRVTVASKITQPYRTFLKDAGYGDLDSCVSIGFAKGILKYNPTVRGTAARAALSLTGNDGDYVVSIDQTDGRKLVETLGCRLPTVGLMYLLFIPYIKDLADQGNAEAQATLNEMVNTKAEWLEDLILDKKRLKIRTKERRLVLPDKDGRFDRQDINKFGYPTAVRDKGEFYYWYPRSDERAAIRDWSSGLNLSLDWVPSDAFDNLGVRLVKIFP